MAPVLTLWGHPKGLKLGTKPPPHCSGIKWLLRAQRLLEAGRQRGEQMSIHPAAMLWRSIKSEGFCGGEDQEGFPKRLLRSGPAESLSNIEQARQCCNSK